MPNFAGCGPTRTTITTTINSGLLDQRIHVLAALEGVFLSVLYFGDSKVIEGLQIFVQIVGAFDSRLLDQWLRVSGCAGRNTHIILECVIVGCEPCRFAKVNAELCRLWAHLIAVYLISGFVFWLLWKEYKEISEMRHGYLADAKKAPDQFTVLTRQIPPSSTETISEHVEHFFTVQASKSRTRVRSFEIVCAGAKRHRTNSQC
jgi:hypothetical protein